LNITFNLLISGVLTTFALLSVFYFIGIFHQIGAFGIITISGTVLLTVNLEYPLIFFFFSCLLSGFVLIKIEKERIHARTNTKLSGESDKE